MSSKPINVGVIGYGMCATTLHIPFINATPELKLYSIMQPRPRPGKDAEKDFPQVPTCHLVVYMLDDPSLEVVFIATPPDTHLSLAKLALEKEKHGTCKTGISHHLHLADS